MRPQSVKELSEAAKDYNYSNNIPLKLWIRTLNLLLGNSNSYLKQNYYDESYKLLIRFCEIMLNKLNNHPEVKSFKNSNISAQQQIYGEYTMLYKKIPLVFEEIDKLKIIIDKNYNEYMTQKQEIDRIRKLQEEKYLQQRKLYSPSDVPRDIPSLTALDGKRGNQRDSAAATQNDDEDDDEFFEMLRNPAIRNSSGNSEGSTTRRDLPQYPALPNYLLQSDTSQFQYDFPSSNKNIISIQPQTPRLPSKYPLELHDIAISKVDSPLPQLPEKLPQYTTTEGHDIIEHKTVNFTEGGLPLRTIFVSSNLKKEFLKISAKNTAKKLETCGILAGKLSRNAFFITHLLIPEQISTPNTCETLDEENLFFTVDKLDLFILGWIHTHPTQSCFLSSVDLHTQNSYQIMLNEAIAIVLSPDEKFHNQDFGCFRLTDPPGLPTISRCNRSGFHPHEESNLYVTCNRVNNDAKMGHVVIKEHLPFEVIDMRKKKKKSLSS